MTKRERPGAERGAPTFREVVGPVRPLAPHSGRVPPKAPRSPRVMAPTTASAASGPGPEFEVNDDGLTIEGRRLGQERSVRDLRRRKFPLLETLDMHGLTAAEGERALGQFLARARGPVRLAVLVVHGKGSHSPGGRSVLRDEIASWLSSPPLGHHVLCFATARPADGGSGALYVLLAPRRT